MDIPNKFCHNCGSKVPPASKFCSSCGTSLASIDEKPPGQQPKPALGRVTQQTYEPAVVDRPNLLGGRRRVDDDDDEQTIRADRVESLAELGIEMNGLEISLDVPGVARESLANVVKSGFGYPQGYQESPRLPGNVSADAVKQIISEGAALRPGTSTEIK